MQLQHNPSSFTRQTLSLRTAAATQPEKNSKFHRHIQTFAFVIFLTSPNLATAEEKVAPLNGKELPGWTTKNPKDRSHWKVDKAGPISLPPFKHAPRTARDPLTLPLISRFQTADRLRQLTAGGSEQPRKDDLTAFAAAQNQKFPCLISSLRSANDLANQGACSLESHETCWFGK